MDSSSRRRIPRALADSLSNALCASIIAYCVLSLIAGQAGFLAFREAKADIARMELQLEAFSLENASLSESRNALVSDRDRIAREARSIGYIRTDEKIVQLSNIDNALAKPKAERLEPIRSGRSSGLPDGIIKLLAILTGASVLMASLVMGYSPRKKQKISSPSSKISCPETGQA
jgi:cell division protein FtsB